MKYWLGNRDPYNGLGKSLYVVQSPIYIKKAGFWSLLILPMHFTLRNPNETYLEEVLTKRRLWAKTSPFFLTKSYKDFVRLLAMSLATPRDEKKGLANLKFGRAYLFKFAFC